MTLPTPGETRRKRALDLRVRCGNMGSDSGSATYQPDAGWAMTNYYETINSSYGIARRSISYVQANSRLITESEINDTYNLLIDAAGKYKLVEYSGKLQVERDRALQARHQIGSSHRGLIAEASCEGEGSLQGGSAMDLSIDVDEIFVGDSASFNELKEIHLTNMEAVPSTIPALVITYQGDLDQVIIQARWLVGNAWTEWKDVTIAQGNGWGPTERGVSQVQVRFDCSLEEGFQEKLYNLSFATLPADAQILDYYHKATRYVLKWNGATGDLFRE